MLGIEQNNFSVKNAMFIAQPIFQKILKAIILCSFIGLAACGPIMKTVTDYHPPESASGVLCISNANHDRDSCESINRREFQQCESAAAINADQAYAFAKNRYIQLLEDYIVHHQQHEEDYAHYVEQKRLLNRDGELEYIKCSNDVKMERVGQNPSCRRFLKQAQKRADRLHEPIEPIKPYAPNRNRMFHQYREECQHPKVNCEQAFDLSYRSCGGSIIYRQVCISNCK